MCGYRRGMAAALLLLLTCSSALADDGAKLAIPSPADQHKAKAAIQDQYSQQLADTHHDNLLDLSQTLLAAAPQSTDPTQQYELVTTARDLAMQAHDLEAADDACVHLARVFAVSLGQTRIDMLQQVTPATMQAMEQLQFLVCCVQTADDALLVDDFDSAKTALTLADPTLHDLHASELSDYVEARKKQLALQQRARAEVATTLDSLKKPGSDAKANLAAGKYICFVRGDWAAGLPYLEKGDDSHLKAVAETDLANPSDSAVQATLADDWYGLGNTPAAKGDQVRLRALYWYERAAEGLSDSAAHRVQGRIRELRPLADRRSSLPALLFAARLAIKDMSYHAAPMTGGRMGHIDFTEIPPGGGILIGLDLYQQTDKTQKQYVSYFRGVYLTSKGQVLGQPVGKPVGDLVELRAKPGYAVGAIIARGGGALDALTVTFMKIHGTKLDPHDSYAADRVGGSGGEVERDYDGKGVPIIGLLGKADPLWHGFGVVFMSKVKDAPDKLGNQ